ncbi:hypothetical protein MDA_GLEAN10010002 [Myotis davidii]|uniref:Uncharacterized protein n=1 Tax=Myotis davidii TaxID=225400 RepID=L5LRF4_MYODS|nr:hypothetical protein MDA_GLEAN10010002 [Myotis davidii]
MNHQWPVDHLLATADAGATPKLAGPRPAKIKHKSNLLELPTVSNGDLLAGLAIPGPIALNGCHNTHAFLHLAKDHMLAIQPLSLGLQMKNWEPLVFGPAFAMDKMPGPVCFRLKFSSSNFSP